MISTEEASQVSAFRLGKGSFDLLIRERRPPSVARVGWEGTSGMAVESNPGSCVECVVRLSLYGTQIRLVVS